MDEIPALDFWDLVIESFHASSIEARGDLKRDRQPRKHINNQTKIKTKQYDLNLVNVDYISPRAKYSRSETMLNIFDDNER